LDLRRLSPPSRDLGVFHETVGDGGGDGGVEEDVAPSRRRLWRANWVRVPQGNKEEVLDAMGREAPVWHRG